MDKISYIAGLFDGEGSVMLLHDRHKTPWGIPTVSISSTTPELMHFLKDEFGGTVCFHKPRKENHSSAYSWRLRYDDALEFLAMVVDLLIVPEKVRRAKLLLSEYKNCTSSNGKYNSVMLSKKLSFEHKFYHPS